MIENIYTSRILILNFGSQYAQLLVRRVRELGVYCELRAWDITEAQIREFAPNGIILSGGPESTLTIDSPRASPYIFMAGVPVLGVCYGMQTIAIQLGGKVNQDMLRREFGYAQVVIIADSPLTRNIQDLINNNQPILNVWMSHSDNITSIPPDFIIVGRTTTCPFAIIANEKKRFYGIQFHPEVTHTCQGHNILKRFVLDICSCQGRWTPNNIKENIINHIKEQVGKENVVLGLSGGVDSTVTAMLLHYAIGVNLTCIFIDNGLLRYNEASNIREIFSKNLSLNIIYVRSEDRFLRALAGIYNPEEKRKIIGRLFSEIFEEQARSLTKTATWLAQGTIYPDIIESAISHVSLTNVIKSHHNVGGLPNTLNLKLIEPLKNLFKDEVRKIGLELGLPFHMLYRHPFPGPGLGIRILGEVKKEDCDLLRKADLIFIEELYKAKLYYKVSQAFAVLLPIYSVGVMGDSRKYERVISLRAVETIDFMTANWSHLSYDFLELVSNRIINEIDGISRVVYDISGKPPATIEWE
ncbi:glutamine-hydrolyzing GMP synthase [Candidatus Palibaumannia cicadellinicola]|uniref:GMP synthase [glutamine-hydrolyzing] n=1 Tax=Baumannia cicadellinicola subsp. Homalodisca coagulata TaxID=374463 RepID=GUAA_BAUCH|nr:glutamine-hydrolyzing GMP synthase [Candidatus Baumannia cicadellinicola]Q1LSJ1.1 RecName: Full=GMP synthase [glutamine-hydrolyzing]; AltName: Full=GMP synthetase; AltName: Full=Glutamine amidotransferase [Baumannia cicadellinicola str. Hc (Homalodisca coagulata)]ABF13795.1 GMP synthetase, glutamine-hydrolyzing [Baumannia cicadellinicola str. Hc (Homalodisca coagulata)]MCJ7461987.1 glutamine-hydrolyzing GMP synthase [Candidatus Baumannia cicadellinicola]MCJ7462773.1 glutamine-hydrolyzing GMP